MTNPFNRVLTVDWSRKHVCDLAAICKECLENPSLTINQQGKLTTLYVVAKRASSLPNAGGPENVSLIISMACCACKEAVQYDCLGRSNWRQPCMLIENFVSKQ